MAILYDSDGNEVEALTTEEVNAKNCRNKNRTRNSIKRKKSDELEKLQTKRLKL